MTLFGAGFQAAKSDRGTFPSASEAGAREPREPLDDARAAVLRGDDEVNRASCGRGLRCRACGLRSRRDHHRPPGRIARSSAAAGCGAASMSTRSGPTSPRNRNWTATAVRRAKPHRRGRHGGRKNGERRSHRRRCGRGARLERRAAAERCGGWPRARQDPYPRRSPCSSRRALAWRIWPLPATC